MLSIDTANELCPQLGDVAASILYESQCVLCHSKAISSWHDLPWSGPESLTVHTYVTIDWLLRPHCATLVTYSGREEEVALNISSKK